MESDDGWTENRREEPFRESAGRLNLHLHFYWVRSTHWVICKVGSFQFYFPRICSCDARHGGDRRKEVMGENWRRAGRWWRDWVAEKAEGEVGGRGGGESGPNYV